MLEPLHDTPRVTRNRRDGVELLAFTRKLCAASSLAKIGDAFLAGFGRVLEAPRYALYILDSRTGRPRHVVSANISDTFLARYEQMPEGRQSDPLLAHVIDTGRAAYNLALMPLKDWLESPFYTRVSRLRGCRQLVMAPIANGSRLVGTINFGTDDTARPYTEDELRLAEALGRLLAVVIERIRRCEHAEREQREALAALDHSGAAVVISGPRTIEPQLNEAARRLIAETVDGADQLDDLIARPHGEANFSRRVDVALTGGDNGVLHAHSRPSPDGSLITILELQRERPRLATGALTALTPRERDVAARVVTGLTDREIAADLCLSQHTVSQYVKRIYRKLAVRSRVDLTRLLLDSPAKARRA